MMFRNLTLGDRSWLCRTIDQCISSREIFSSYMQIYEELRLTRRESDSHMATANQSSVLPMTTSEDGCMTIEIPDVLVKSIKSHLYAAAPISRENIRLVKKFKLYNDVCLTNLPSIT